MVKSFLLVFCIIGIIYSCSANRKLLKEHDYATVIRNYIERLNHDAKDTKASNTLKQTYAQAIGYYQNQIDWILTGNDPFKWNNTMDIMQKTNELSEDILYNSSASQLICDPKIYRNEMADVSLKAAQELYLQGINCLSQGSREKAREAYAYFIRTSQLKPEYKDVEQKIREAANQATYKVIIEEFPVSYQNNLLDYSTRTFNYSLANLLRKKFPSNEFIAFYSPLEAESQNIYDPDYSIQIDIEDFEIESWNIRMGYAKPHFTEYEKDTIRYTPYTTNLPTPRTPAHTPNNRVVSSPYQIRSQLLMSARSVLKIYSLYENKVVFKKRIPAHYTEDLDHPVSPELGQSYLPESPDYQLYFDYFSLSMIDKVALPITDFFNHTISIPAKP